MIAHRRYLAFRTEKLESQNRWLTILTGATLVVLLVVITAGPTLVRIDSDARLIEQGENLPNERFGPPTTIRLED